MKRVLLSSIVALGAVAAAIAGSVWAASPNSYTQTNLVADTAGMAAHTDPNLLNPWGIAFLPGNPFWIADNNAGVSTLYDASGNAQQPTVIIPAPKGSAGIASPTGIVANATGKFQVTANGAAGPSLFIFDTEDGTIAGWNGVGSAAVLAVDNSNGGNGAVYKGLAPIANASGNFLLAANFRSGKVEIYGGNFQSATLAGSFTDPGIPAGFAPFGIHAVNGQVFVTYAMQDAAKHDPVNAPGNGYVSVFDTNGNFVRRFASNGTLNSPWGAVMAPTGFGAFGGDVLVGNFGDGTMNAFDPATGQFQGQLEDANGNTIVNPSLWDMVYGSGGTGDPNTLYFSAGLNAEMHGLFATLTAGQPHAAAPDFSISVSPQSLTVTPGQSANFSIAVTPAGGFNSAVSLACANAPAAYSCTFNPSSLTPANGPQTAMLSVVPSATATYMPAQAGGGGFGSGLFPQGPGGAGGPIALGAGLCALALALSGLAWRRKPVASRRRRLAPAGALALLAVAALFTPGCGKYNSSQQAAPSTATITVTGTSQTTSHSTNVTVTVQ